MFNNRRWVFEGVQVVNPFIYIGKVLVKLLCLFVGIENSEIGLRGKIVGHCFINHTKIRDWTKARDNLGV